MAFTPLPCIPEVSFTLATNKAVFPFDDIEVIELTPALSAWAELALPRLREAFMVARADELRRAKPSADMVESDRLAIALQTARMISESVVCSDNGAIWITPSRWELVASFAKLHNASRGVAA